jgi:hypothetical protein
MVETEKFRNKQDKINNFIHNKLVMTASDDDTIRMSDLIEGYSDWHSRKYNQHADRKQLEDKFKNSKISKFVKLTKDEELIVSNHKFYESGMTMRASEKRYKMILKNSIVVFSETPEEFYKRKCGEFNNQK